MAAPDGADGSESVTVLADQSPFIGRRVDANECMTALLNPDGAAVIKTVVAACAVASFCRGRFVNG